MDIDKKFLEQAAKQAEISLQKGGFPAGAVLVKEGKIISKGLSLGAKLNDPTEHSETSCIRKACKKLKTTNLKDCTLYASLEPCLMCFSVANWSNVSMIVYGCKKNEEMVKIGCYEGMNNLENINDKNNRKVELVYIEDYESDSLKMIKEWENKII